jgi:anti-sigma factor RsiW
MNEELSFKLQAFLDGELPEAEARDISALIARDADAAALHRELKHTRAALAGFEQRIVVPETREFYFSKIAREIERTERAPAPAPDFSLLRWLRRALVPVAGVAALLLAVMLLRPAPGGGTQLEMAMNDASAMTYRNFESGTTLVWLSFPAENGLAQGDGAARVQ